MDYLDVLNDEQRKAVLHEGASLLILAGAGSGKTRVITTKVAWLIREKGYDPRSILALTFTNKAAREMSSRAQGIEPLAASVLMRTFHSFGAWFLRRNHALAGLPAGFVIYDDDDSAALLSSIMEDAPRAEVKEAARLIARAKDYFLGPEDALLAKVDHRLNFRKLYAAYEERLKAIGNVDFGDLIKKPVELLRNNADLKRQMQSRFKCILVDEYQDSNIAQFELLKELSGPESYVCVVGDDDQSIYRFRGAEVRNILDFPTLFDNVDIIRLVQNYRSTTQILQLAGTVVNKNKGRLGKELVAVRGSGKKPVLSYVANQQEEAVFCATLIKGSLAAGAQYSDWAILYRTNAQSQTFQTLFTEQQIPYQVVGALRFYEREEIKDALALLSLLANPKDEVAFRRVANKPTRGIGPSAMDKILMSETLSTDTDIPGLSTKAKQGLMEFIAALDEGKKTLNPDKTVREVNAYMRHEVRGSSTVVRGSKIKNTVRGVEGLSKTIAVLVNESGIARYHVERDEISGQDRLENLQELANAATPYAANMDGLLEFLEHLELDREAVSEANNKILSENEKPDLVTLITLHNTKGLEFPRVIITGLEQGIFPREDKQGEDMEEERRLFYVGVTRAMNELYLTSCRSRFLYGRTTIQTASVFLKEAGMENMQVLGSSANNFSHYPGREFMSTLPGGGVPAPKTSSDGRWTTGNKVYHDEMGYGAVVAIQEDEQDGPLITVQFENGRQKTFLSLYQSKNYDKIGSEY
ncbi:MAG: ATP-dependent helicase [Spirochaetaceae bacterium]|nr:ATP-dependent helicase [Spirochaetaceae bacterium]